MLHELILKHTVLFYSKHPIENLFYSKHPIENFNSKKSAPDLA